MKKVLEVFAEPISSGGQEKYVENMYTGMKDRTFKIDVFTPFKCDNENFINTFKNNGENVYTKDKIFGRDKSLIFKKELNKFLKTHNYDIVHIHSGSSLSLMYGCFIAKKNNIKKVIVHSHCAGIESIKHRIIKFFTSIIIERYADYYYACSNIAGKWKYNRNILKCSKFKVLNNAIDTDKIFYDENIRKETRKDLKIEDKFVVGHIGRFTEQKNHRFLINVFEEISRQKNNAVLILIGEGTLENEIKLLVKKKNLEERVYFLGRRTDINRILNAMDVFVLPSLYEGLPIVGVEAQATGLPVITSNNVTKDMPISSLSTYLPLENYNLWAKKIIKVFNEHKRNSTTLIIKDKDYDIQSVSNNLRDDYNKILNEEI